MKKITLVLGLMLACLVQVQAQKLSGGVKAGLNRTTWAGDAVSSFSDLMNTTGIMKKEMKTGFHIGGFLNLPLSPHFSFEPGLYYANKGMKVEQTFSTNSLLKVRAEITNESHYLDMPLLAKMNVGQGFQIFAGPQLSYLVANKIRGEAGILGISLEQDYNWDAGLRDFDFALTGGIGYQFANGILLNAAYDHGLTTLDAGKSNFDVYNRAVKFSVGYLFK